MPARWRLSVVATVLGAVADVRLDADACLHKGSNGHRTQFGVARHVLFSPSTITAY